MIAFAKRNMLIFFRDKAAVFFSLLSVFIIIGLYAFFLGDVWAQSLTDIREARQLMDTWIMAGLLAVTSITTTMGAFGVLVDDQDSHISKDFMSSPLKRRHMVAGYTLSAYIIGVIMCLVALVLAQAYILSSGGDWLSATAIAKCIGLILISTFCNTAVVLFIVSFFRSQSAFSTGSTIIGTLIGFLTGIYLPIGQLPEGVQSVIKIFPVSHAAVLFRQIMMHDQALYSFAGVPDEYVDGFHEMMGVTFTFAEHQVTWFESLAFLVVTAIVFFGLSVLNLSRKSK